MTESTAKAKVAARNTLLQGLLAAIAIGLLTGALDALNAEDFTWRTVAIGAAVAAIASVTAYLQHAYAAPYLALRRGRRGPV